VDFAGGRGACFSFLKQGISFLSPIYRGSDGMKNPDQDQQAKPSGKQSRRDIAASKNPSMTASRATKNKEYYAWELLTAPG